MIILTNFSASRRGGDVGGKNTKRANIHTNITKIIWLIKAPQNTLVNQAHKGTTVDIPNKAILPSMLAYIQSQNIANFSPKLYCALK